MLIRPITKEERLQSAQPDAALEISTFSALLCGVCDFPEARQYFSGLEGFNEAAPLEQVFFRKPLYIEDYF